MMNCPVLTYFHCVCSQDAYDAAHETERKRALSALLSQTKQQERKDAEVRNLLNFAVLLSARFCCHIPLKSVSFSDFSRSKTYYGISCC